MIVLPCQHDPAKPRIRVRAMGERVYAERFDKSAGDCPFCFAGLTRADVHRAYGGDGRVIPELPDPAPPGQTECKHRGKAVSGDRRVALGLSHGGDWRECNHPATPLGAHACPCTGCGLYCPGYTLAEPITLWPGWADPIQEPYRVASRSQRGVGEMHAALAALEPPAPPTCDGDGVVICGEGRYWAGVYIAVRMVREAGCRLPIEVWHRPSAGEAHKDWLRDVPDLTFVDADAEMVANGDSRVPVGAARVGGWEAKLYALTHTAFRRVVNLDADVYPVGDVGLMLDRLGDAGLCGWQGRSNGIKWDRLGYGREPADLPPHLPGGTVAFDRANPAAWGVLWRTHWMCQHSDYYFPAAFPGEWCMVGDDEAMRVAMWLAGVTPTVLGGLAKSTEHGFSVELDGRPLLSHRFKGKFVTAAALPGDGRAHRHFADVLDRGR